MTLQFSQFLIVCPLVFFAGFVDAVAGGGGLISLPAYMMAGLPAHYAIATNKMSSSMGTTIATTKYALSGFIKIKMALSCVIFAFAGSNIGAKLALMVDDVAFRIFMLVALPLIALYIISGKALVEEKEPLSQGRTIFYGMIIAFVIGIYDGFYGPGTGTFLLLLLTTVAHMNLQQANGIAKVINLSTNISALVVFILNGKVLFVLGITAGFFSIAGNYMGAHFFEKGGSKIAKPLMILVIMVFFVKTALEVFL